VYCPNCGQQQISDTMKFCSRCGLPISGLAEWIAGRGTPAVPEVPQPHIRPRRRKGVRRGAKLLFLSGVLIPVALVLSIIFDHPGPLLIPFTVFITGLSIMLYSRLFSEEDLFDYQSQPSRLAATPERNALPPAANTGMEGVGGQRMRTAEMTKPPSVTEHTTKLLDKDN
jgi:hypothetical protein